MKKHVKRLFLLGLMGMMLVSAPVQAYATTAAKPTPSLTGNQREDVVRIADSQYGYTEGSNNDNIYAKEIGGANNQSWCAYFVTWCMRKAGVAGSGYPSNAIGSCSLIVNWYKQKGQWHRTHGSTWKNTSRGVTDNTALDSSYVPQKGDLVLFDWDIDSKNGPEHIGIVKSYSNGQITCVDGNNSSGKVGYKTYSTTRKEILGFCSPTYKTTAKQNRQPVFNLEKVEAGEGTVSVTGWAYDPDEPSKSLEIHVYVGGPAGSAQAEGHGGVMANHYRPDVNNAYGISGSHGFSSTIQTNKRGNQEVWVFALDTAGGTNPIMGHPTVYIATPYNISFNKSAVTVNENATTSLIVSFAGENIRYMSTAWEGTEEIASTAWGKQDGWTQEILITGKKAGTNKLQVQLMDQNQSIIYRKSISVTTKHVHNYNTKKVTKQPTCTSTGIRSSVCACGAVSSSTETLAAKGHTIVNDASVAATCTREGRTAGKYCSVCNAVTVKQTTIAATGHKGGAATCENRAKCESCGTYYGDLAEHQYNNDDKCTFCGALSPDAKEETDDNPEITEPEDEGDETDIDDEDDNEDEEISEVEVGDVVGNEDTGEFYEVTANSGETKTVEILSGKEKVKVAVIPGYVVISGEKFKVTSIADGAFKKNSRLVSVVIGSNVTKVGQKAFYGCKNLKLVSMGRNVTQIGDKAFYGCKKLMTITIPKNVNKIGKYAFYNCNKLKSITIKTTELTSENVGTKAFKGIYKKAVIRTPKGMADEYKTLLKSKGAGAKVTVK